MASKKFQPVGCGMAEPKTELGQFIRSCRITAGMTQTELGDSVELAQNSITMIELGKRKSLPDELARKFARHLNCSLDELQNKIPTKPIPEPTTELGKLIRSRREEMGLSVSDFDTRMKNEGVCTGSRFELRCTDTLLPKTARALAKVLQINPEVLYKFSAISEKKPSSPLGQLIRDRRQELGMTLADLAKEVGVTRQRINQIEIGGSSLDDNGVVKMARALQLEMNDLRRVMVPKKRVWVMVPRSNHLGAFFSERRLILELTQREVAERSCLSTALVSHIETGRLIPKLSSLKKLAQTLECEVPLHLLPKKFK